MSILPIFIRDPVSVLLQQQKGEGVQTVRSSDTKSNLLLVARHLWACTVDCGRLRAGCALSSQTMSMNTRAVRPFEGKAY